MATLSINTKTIEERINVLIKALIKHYEKQYPGNYGSTDFEIEQGTKYYKIIHISNANSDRPGRSVHAFVSRQTGAVYKPASWKSPAKHVRYQLLDDASFQDCIQRADWAGGYLYMS